MARQPPYPARRQITPPAPSFLLPAPMPSPRDTLLARVTSALAPLPKRAPLPNWDNELVIMRQARGPVDAWTFFAERLKAVNGTPLASTTDLVATLTQGGWKHGYCDPALWDELRPAFDAAGGFNVETTFDRARIDDYQFCITAATAGIAETGTLVLSDLDTSRRLAALSPWVHVAVLRRAQIHIDVPAAIAALPQDPNVIWCTGPSKTADVEGILIEGVHGPGIQIALLLG
ncbi:MAG: LUD domain-containing protein [Verrucomicrobia bacterium]|nr:LUD domain-containing protein [Verrucomicrobiota bacterium]